MELATRQSNGKIRFTPHSGQWKAWNSLARFILILAGTQSGKTSFGPHWLHKEIQEQGPGDYIVVTPTFPLLEKKALPEFLKLFRQWLRLGEYNHSLRCFTFSEEGATRTFGSYDPDKPTKVWFGYAVDPQSLESSTAKAAWLDEAGQTKFKLESWRAILRRLSLAQGRVLLTTTPYDLGWLKQQLYDRYQRIGTEAEQPGDSDIDVVRFDSTQNPLFPQEEFERARRDLPQWQFDLFYRGIFTRPAGLIYSSFIDEYDAIPHPHNGPVTGHKCRPFQIPDTWPRLGGLDFGGVNTCAIFLAENPETRPRGGRIGSGRRYLYREYLAGAKTAKGHVIDLRRGEPSGLYFVGGAKSEGQWRDEFRQGGLTVHEPPISDVEVGITRVYGTHANNEVIVFDTCDGHLSQKMSYSRVLDASGQPTVEIADKAAFHFMDAERYIDAMLKEPPKGGGYSVADAIMGIKTSR